MLSKNLPCCCCRRRWCWQIIANFSLLFLPKSRTPLLLRKSNGAELEVINELLVAVTCAMHGLVLGEAVSQACRHYAQLPKQQDPRHLAGNPPTKCTAIRHHLRRPNMSLPSFSSGCLVLENTPATARAVTTGHIRVYVRVPRPCSDGHTPYICFWDFPGVFFFCFLLIRGYIRRILTSEPAVLVSDCSVQINIG